MFAWLLAVGAMAGNLYVNDVLVNPVDLQGMTLEKVDVTIDAQGNIRIAAPGYKIEIVEPTPMPATRRVPSAGRRGTSSPSVCP